MIRGFSTRTKSEWLVMGTTVSAIALVIGLIILLIPNEVAPRPAPESSRVNDQDLKGYALSPRGTGSKELVAKPSNPVVVYDAAAARASQVSSVAVASSAGLAPAAPFPNAAEGNFGRGNDAPPIAASPARPSASVPNSSRDASGFTARRSSPGQATSARSFPSGGGSTPVGTNPSDLAAAASGPPATAEAAPIVAPEGNVVIPAAFSDSPTDEKLTAGNQRQIQNIQDKFVNDIGGDQQDPADPKYLPRWQKAQWLADQQYRTLFGYQAFLQRQIQQNLSSSRAN